VYLRARLYCYIDRNGAVIDRLAQEGNLRGPFRQNVVAAAESYRTGFFAATDSRFRCRQWRIQYTTDYRLTNGTSVLVRNNIYVNA
jgi:hypothetical protein